MLAFLPFIKYLTGAITIVLALVSTALISTSTGAALVCTLFAALFFIATWFIIRTDRQIENLKQRTIYAAETVVTSIAENVLTKLTGNVKQD